MSNRRPATVALTADTCARAIIAAARAYADDPVRVFVARGGPTRRAMTPAAEALAELCGVPLVKIAPMIGIAPRGVARARANGGAGYVAAYKAALRAVSYAGWKPESRAGLVTGQSGDALPAPKASPAPAPNPDEIELFRPPSAITVAPKATRTITLGAARREVLAAIGDEALTPPAIAERLNLPLAMVRQALDDLAEHREAVASTLTADGWKARFWKAV